MGERHIGWDLNNLNVGVNLSSHVSSPQGPWICVEIRGSEVGALKSPRVALVSSMLKSTKDYSGSSYQDSILLNTAELHIANCLAVVLTGQPSS